MSLKLSGRAVTLIRCHTPIHAPGVQGLAQTNTVDENATGSKGKISLVRTDKGVLVTAGDIEIEVPDGNIVNIVYKKESK